MLIKKSLLFASHAPVASGRQPRQGGQTIIQILRNDLEATNMSHDWYLEAQHRTSWRAAIRDTLAIHFETDTRVVQQTGRSVPYFGKIRDTQEGGVR